MAVWQVTVSEIIEHEVRYTVEADSLEDARRLALAGDTIYEQLINDHGVLDRYVNDDPILVPETWGD